MTTEQLKKLYEKARAAGDWPTALAAAKAVSGIPVTKPEYESLYRQCHPEEIEPTKNNPS